MENNHRTALKSFGKGQGKDTDLFALYQWLQGWNIAVFNIFKTIL